MPIVDIHTHCAPRPAGDPFVVAETLRGMPAGRDTVTWRNAAEFFGLDVRA